MLTRLKVSGFKNLVDVDVRFGAFTCIAGANGVGKSNLFDAIRFLSATAQMPLQEAALSLRDGNGKQSDIRNLFHRVGDRYVDKMSFEAEIIIPSEGTNDLGEKIKAAENFFVYSLEISYKKGINHLTNKLEVSYENLAIVERGYISKYSFFEKYPILNTDNEVINIIYSNVREKKKGTEIVLYHPINSEYKHEIPFVTRKFSQTLLSTLKDDYFAYKNYPVLDLLHREMSSWMLLQLEPSPLRKPNEFIASNKLGTDGSNLAASFYYLVEERYQQDVNKNEHKIEDIEAQVYAQASNRLAELIDDVDKVWVDRDDKRELLTLMVRDKQGTVYPASSLSDGTLRFLALTALELDPDSFRLLCLEEPENGIHPNRIRKILQLLQDMAVDLEEPIDFDNPLRQVIINTHSPVVVQQVPEDSLLIADLETNVVEGKRFKQACFKYLENTWRDVESDEERKYKVISKGKLLSYLNPVSRQFTNNRVVDRPDLQSLLPGS